jgi:dienelactone hydrolase
MADVVLFHHAQGRTPGVEAFAERLRGAGHTVTVPDLFEGATFDTVEEGVDHARRIGFDTVMARGRAAAENLPQAVVYAGFSLGVMPAQLLAQTRPGARGCLLLHGCLPPSEFGTPWPEGVAVQVHGMADDPWFAGEDLDAARALVAEVEQAELFLYPGDRHLFADSSLPSYLPEAASLLEQRVLDFLAALD